MSEVVNGLWIQGQLSSMEMLTVQSFLSNGFTFQLWTYEPETMHAPRGTIIKDAHEILPSSQVFSYRNATLHGHGKGSYAGFSDIFRYKLLYEHGGIWTDMDITCLKPFELRDDYFFRFHFVNGAVGNFMKCPKHSPVMKWCYEHAAAKVTEDSKDWMLPIRILNEGIEQSGLSGYIKKISNNDSFPEVARLLSANAEVPSEWLIIHWMNEEWRRFRIDKNIALKESVYHTLLKKYHVPVKSLSFRESLAYRIRIHDYIYLLVTSYHAYKSRLSKNNPI